MILMQNPPPHFSPKAEIALVIPFFSEDKVLLLQRQVTHPQANLWCIPGGKLKSGEKPEEGARRELEEETGIGTAISSLIYLGKYFVQYPNGDFICYLFKTTVEGSPEQVKINQDEHQSFYLCPIEQTTTLPLTPGLAECFDLAK